MNIGIAVHRYPPHIGGSELYAENLAEELHGRGHNVKVFTTNHPNRGNFPYSVKEFQNVIPENFGYFAWPGIFRPRTLRELRQLDAIHCLNASMFSAVVGAFVNRAFGTTAILTTTYHPPNVQAHQRLKLLYDKVILQRLLKSYDRLIVSSEFEEKQLEKQFDLEGYPVSRFHIPPIIDSPAEIGSRFVDDFTILYVGRLDAHKGILTFLRSVERFSNDNPAVRCVVVGERERWYDWPVEVTEIIERLDEKIEFTGFIEEDELAKQYATASVLVLPSTYETYGQVLAEALSYGTPIVSTPVGAAPELVEEGVNGYLYEQDSVDELTSRLEDILNEEGSRMEENARMTVEGITWNSLVNDLVEIYKQ